MEVDVIAIAQKVGDAAYAQHEDRYEAAKAYQLNTEAARDALRGRGNGMRGKVAELVYNELVAMSEDPVEAAWFAAERCGLKNAHFDIGELPRDPMQPDYEALGREPMTDQYRDSMDSAEGPAIQ